MSRWLRHIAAGLLAFAPLSTSLADSSATVSVSGTQADTVATLSGYSSPGAFITVLDGGSVVGTTSADAGGVFSKTLTSQSVGAHNFGFDSTDTSGLSAPEVDLLVTLQANATTTVSNIVLPSTITLGAGAKPAVEGMSAPGSQITLYVDSNPLAATITTAADGTWSHIFSSLVPGTHGVYAVATTQGGLISNQSSTVSVVVSCSVADFNCNGTVDIVDFSVLMYYWGTSNPTADLNNDGIVDLTDFSIMMYYWSQ